MDQQEIIRAFKFALVQENLKPVEFAQKCGKGNSIVSKFMSGKTRPSDEFFRMLCQSWSNKALGEHIFTEHIKDEAVRAGFDPNHFSVKVKSEQDQELDKAL